MNKQQSAYGTLSSHSLQLFKDINLLFLAILSKQHYLLYCLVPAIQARMLITFVCDEENEMELKQVNVPVRVGQVNFCYLYNIMELQTIELNLFLARRLMWLVKLENRKRLLDSKPIPHRCCWHLGNERSWQPKNVNY